MKFISLLVLVSLLTSGCVVSKKKYDVLLRDKAMLGVKNRELQDIVDLKKIQDDSVAQMRTRLAEGGRIVNDLRGQAESQARLLDEQKRKIDQLTFQNTELASVSASERDELSKQLMDRQRDIEDKEQALRASESALRQKEVNLARNMAVSDSMQAALQLQNLEIQKLTAALDAQAALMTSLRASVNDALRGFSAADLTVREENGRVYVSLSQNLLFPKGSAKIDPKGVDAIQRLAAVLATNQDIQIMVEGHTDSDGSSDLNWDLSTGRATSVVKILTSKGVEPKRVTAAGRGLYLPIAPNDVEANKSKNRRTEIVLSPKLDQLYQLIK